jgi:multimeric flavodoxin WrbA
MKVVFINGSPRKNWNTHKLLMNAMKGAEDAGAETEFYNLYDLQFTGCHSCFACKVKNAKTHGACSYPDDLKPVMKSVMEADVLVLGSPVYFGDISAQLNSFLERLKFAVVTYESDGPGRNKLDLPKEKRCAMIVSMGCPEDMMEQIGYTQHFDAIGQTLGHTLGHESAKML